MDAHQTIERAQPAELVDLTLQAILLNQHKIRKGEACPKVQLTQERRNALAAYGVLDEKDVLVDEVRAKMWKKKHNEMVEVEG